MTSDVYLTWVCQVAGNFGPGLGWKMLAENRDLRFFRVCTQWKAIQPLGEGRDAEPVRANGKYGRTC